MAKKPKPKLERPDPAKALAAMPTPGIKWKVVLQVAAGFAVVWALAIGLQPWISFYGIGAAGALSAVAIGFGLYVWRLTSKSKKIVEILKGATDEAGRKAAVEALAERGKGGDVMSKLAQAQLLAQESPSAAMELLESIDIKKAPALMQDDVRANLALLYLVAGKTREARELADQIKSERQSVAKSKALYAAVVAESFARTGKHDEAKTLLEAYDVDDAEFAEVRPLMLRAQAYTFVATKNRGLARTAMQKLAALDPNMLAGFLMKGASPAMQALAREVVQQTGALPKQKIKMRMK